MCSHLIKLPAPVYARSTPRSSFRHLPTACLRSAMCRLISRASIHSAGFHRARPRSGRRGRTCPTPVPDSRATRRAMRHRVRRCENPSRRALLHARRCQTRRARPEPHRESTRDPERRAGSTRRAARCRRARCPATLPGADSAMSVATLASAWAAGERKRRGARNLRRRALRPISHTRPVERPDPAVVQLLWAPRIGNAAAARARPAPSPAARGGLVSRYAQ